MTKTQPTNSGATWISNSVPNYVSSFACSSDGSKLVAVELGGLIYASTNSGATWMTIDTDWENWSSIASSSDGSKLAAVVFDGGIYNSYSTPSPQLNIMPVSNNLAFSWLVPSTNFVLQQNCDLTTTNWVTLTNTPTLNLTNLQNQVMLSPSNGSGFYRLAPP